MGRMLVLGISGPIAAGKGIAIQTLKGQVPRATVFSADKVAHRAYARGTPLSQKLIAHFGDRIQKKGGGIDRKKLGEIVFAHPKALRYLNRLTHTKIRNTLKNEIVRARRLSIPLFIVDAALLHTISLHSFVHASWVVTAKESIRMERLIRDRKMSRNDALVRIRAQRGIPFRCSKDFVLTNNGTKAQFIRKVRMAYNDVFRHGRI